jgi:glycosyltransferase involved in cell wall biosynthesis
MLDAVLAEQYPDLEIVIADGFSNDSTVDLLKSYGEKVRWVSEPDDGEYFAYNKALAMSSKEIIKFMSDDDTLHPGALLSAGNYLLDHPEVDMLFGQIIAWDVRGKEVVRIGHYSARNTSWDKSCLTLRHWLRETTGTGLVASFIRRRVFDRIGTLAVEYVPGDLEYCLRAAATGIEMDVHPDDFIDYFVTGNNGILTKSRKLHWDAFRLTLRYGKISDVVHSMYWHLCRARLYEFCNHFGIHPLRLLRRLKSGLDV